MGRKSNRQFITVGLMVKLQCSHCQKFFPANDEYFNRHPQSYWGLSDYCKSCYSVDMKVIKKAQIARLRQNIKRYFDYCEICCSADLKMIKKVKIARLRQKIKRHFQKRIEQEALCQA